MENQFSRIEMLIGIDGVERLQKARVAVFGTGGVGGFTVEALARSGVGEIDIFDMDTVNESNINRQIIATHDTIGMKKIDAMEMRIKSINPNAKVNKHDVFYLPENADEFNLSVYDYVIDAIDTVSAKIEIAVRCEKLKVKLISSMGTGNKLNPTMLKISDIYKTSVCPLARVMRYELKRRGVRKLKVLYSEEVPIKQAKPEIGKKAVPGSIAFVPSVAGLIIASEVIKELAGV